MFNCLKSAMRHTQSVKYYLNVSKMANTSEPLHDHKLADRAALIFDLCGS